MITALELENFKGFAERQRIDFAPLTLLFGANSAGKSTVLQALLYLHELLDGGPRCRYWRDGAALPVLVTGAVRAPTFKGSSRASR